MITILIVPKLPPEDPEFERLHKLRKYFNHHLIFTRYKITFKQFVTKVDEGTWDPYLAK